MPYAETSPRPVSWRAVEAMDLPAPPHVATDPSIDHAASYLLNWQQMGGEDPLEEDSPEHS